MTSQQHTEHDSEPIARLKREHAAMVAFIRKLLPDDLVDDARDLLPHRNITFVLRTKNGEILDIWDAMSQGDGNDSDSAATPPPVALSALDNVEPVYHTPDTMPTVAAGDGARDSAGTVDVGAPIFTQQIIEKIEQRAIQRNSMYRVHKYVTSDGVAVFTVGFQMRHLRHAPMWFYLNEKGWVNDKNDATHYEAEDEAELAANILNASTLNAQPASGKPGAANAETGEGA